MIPQLAGPDAGVAWHYGDPLREQRLLAEGAAGVDLSHRPVFTVTGPDRLSWLNNIVSQKIDDLAPGVWTQAYILDAHGHLAHAFTAVDDGETLWGSTEPGHEEALVVWLTRMRFAARAEIDSRAATHALVIAPAAAGGAGPRIVPRDQVEATLGPVRAGTWAWEALRIADGVPRIFLDTDDKTIPNELANPVGDLLGPAVHLRKGCYPGQETVARVYNLGRPPRRLTLLLLDGSVDTLPEVGAELLLEGRVVGRVGTSARHFELGPIALALVKRNVPPDAELLVGEISASQEPLVDPEVGLHVRPRLR